TKQAPSESPSYIGTVAPKVLHYQRGAFRGFALLDQYCDKHGVYLDIIPGEAHWKNGTCEQAIQGVKELMTRLCLYDPDLSTEAALAEAITVFNHRDMIRGFSQAQHVLGRGSDETDRFVEAGQGLPPGLLVENPVGEFERATKRRAEAEKIHADWNARQSSGPDWPTPWTFHQVADSIGGNQFKDISSDKPSVEEWNRAQDATEEVQPTRLRARQKRPPIHRDAPGDDVDDGGDQTMPPARSSGRGSVQRPRLEASYTEPTERGECWWNTVPEQAWPERGSSFWDHGDAAVEIEVALPESRRGIDHMAKNFEGYFVGQLKRKAVEVSERRLTAEELEAFRSAKQIEVKNFLSADAFQAIPEHMQPSKDQAVGMRWVLTWKVREDGTRKAKARAVLLGCQDPSYEHRSTAAPVMTRQSRQMLLQMAAWKKWRIRKGDVSGAFLQGREYPDTLFCIPTKEICEAMGLPENSVTRIKRACYGLVDAPLEWYRTVVGRSTVDTIIRANVLLSHAKARRDHKMLIHAFPEDVPLGPVAWVDAASQSRVDGGSTEGIVIGMAPQGLLQGEVCEISLMSWHSSKVGRMCRSPGAAEALAAIDGEDSLYYARYQWSELLHGVMDLRFPDMVVSQVPGCLVTDSRNVYDKMINETIVVKGAEKRTSIELLGLKE
ncbi:RE1, partial [Symbiodinium sp. CCMP2456]